MLESQLDVICIKVVVKRHRGDKIAQSSVHDVKKRTDNRAFVCIN